MLNRNSDRHEFEGRLVTGSGAQIQRMFSCEKACLSIKDSANVYEEVVDVQRKLAEITSGPSRASIKSRKSTCRIGPKDRLGSREAGQIKYKKA